MAKKKKTPKYCVICEKYFPKTNNFTRHIKYVHIGTDILFQCSIGNKCKRTYIHRRNLAAHYRLYHKKTEKMASRLSMSSTIVEKGKNIELS